MINLLVVDDEHTIRESIRMFMSEKGHRIHTASTIKKAISAFETLTPEVVILDIRLPDGSGLDALNKMHAFHPLSKIIMITAFQDMETTIEAMKRGAYDYIHKPLDADELEKTVNDAIISYREDTRTKTPDNTPSEEFDKTRIVGKSRVMKDIYKMMGMLCQNRATALITGETGTGKELVAKRIHLSSRYCNQPFITFDCSAVVDTLLESELFGHEKGAFTGAVNTRPGKIELAADGTLFLDEIGELPLNLQAKLLGFLERKQYMRVGGNTLLKSRARILAATNRNLSEMVRKGDFRGDLYYRLNVVTMTLPPLRERLSDIDELVAHFIRKSAYDLETPIKTIEAGCMDRLKQHPWTGNVRELENVITSASLHSRSSVILPDDINRLLSNQPPVEKTHQNTYGALSQVEKHHIFNMLEAAKWNKTRAAKILEISLPTLRKKIKKYHLSPSQK